MEAQHKELWILPTDGERVRLFLFISNRNSNYIYIFCSIVAANHLG